MARIVMADGAEAWLATRYDDVKAVLGDARFSACPRNAGYPFIALSRKAQLLNDRPTFPFMDSAEHAKYRRMLTKFFTVPRIEQRRQRIEQLAETLLDRLIEAGPPQDFVKGFALPIPSTVLAELLGVPHEDQAFFQQQAKARMDMRSGTEVQIRAGRALEDYIGQLVARKEKDPSGDDVLSRLVVEQLQPGHVSREDLIAMGRLLIVAGHDTTANMIAAGIILLLQHPDQMRELIADPALLPGAIEEMLRFWTLPHFNSTRVAMQDVLVGDTLVKAGEGVVALLIAGNHDPRAFPSPEKFDIHRNPRNHLAFAYGPHQCLGQFLGRLELEVALKTLLRRLPGIRLAEPVSELEFTEAGINYGVERLPIAWS
ncbi:MAG: cytochrome P450 [Reyranellaceae bacterium]